MHWQATAFPNGEGTVRAAFTSHGDGPVFHAVPCSAPCEAPAVTSCGTSGASPRTNATDTTNATNAANTTGDTTIPAPTSIPSLTLGVRDGHLLLEARRLSPDPRDSNAADDLMLDMDDACGIEPGTAHDITLTFGAFGTRIFLDGYQCFACATNLSPARVAPAGEFIADAPAGATTIAIHDEPWDAGRIANASDPPEHDIAFAGPALAARDVARIANTIAGALHARFRVRGRGQHGVILAAGFGGGQSAQPAEERMTVAIDAAGITLTMRDDAGAYPYHAAGNWDDGDWHDLVIRSGQGAVDVFVDGFSVLHQPGQMWFADLARNHTPIDRFAIGCNLAGVRLMGEVRSGGVLLHAPTDGQIARLARRIPLVTTALFDAGYAGSASYRIPSLVRTPAGTLIAGADQRTGISNDAPNHINFVVRRSPDGGRTWLPMQTVIAMPGREDGLDGASAIDSCPVADRRTGRVVTLIDLNPGGVGLTNCERGLGVDARGDLKLWDADGNESTLGREPDAGDVWRSPDHAGPGQRWHTARTSYIAEIHSDDDGETWSAPRIIDAQVKEPWMRFMGVCPGAGIQLVRGPHTGRLLIPFYCSGDSRAHYSGGALISDDGGETWRRGRMINEGREVNGIVVDPATMHDDDATTSETTFVERADGDVVAFFRNQHRSGRVGKAVSHDGGETWDGLEFDPALPEIFSQPNALAAPQLGPDAVLFANASQMLPYRGRGVVRLSRDGGHTWERSLCVHPRHHVYQCMAACEGSQLGLLWEIETSGVYITYIPFAWFSDGHGGGVAATAGNRYDKEAS
ncbi:sialidase family protein [Bifidobacterium avesanii]|uniref:exo-alpha-sialidase n=1 Tax=Bifidobacterium avesanii TaxID=1798157 RepID=A0A7K3TFQ2_9BIFI|nr:sialidase family protein [Bifidobacterium avesanii]KAB8294422.1 sialidase [Bifidobacterium avesanii]NEG77746.1 exo-alpha-sialidase [Bifidobacterium avesanii]